MGVQALSDGEGKTVTIARSSANKKKNRFANISACKYFQAQIPLYDNSL